MKFGKKLRFRAVYPWIPHYINVRAQQCVAATPLCSDTCGRRTRNCDAVPPRMPLAPSPALFHPLTWPVSTCCAMYSTSG